MGLVPKIFIGSSAEAKNIADAVDSGLRPDAEPTVWTSGAFDLSEVTLSGLIRQAKDSDFGIFVFSGEDTAEIRGRKLRVARDNVVFELGLFTGVLGPSRCFFVVPRDVDLPFHLPSDLLGITFFKYSPRLNGNWSGEMNTFCSMVKSKMQKEGFHLYSTENYLMELAVEYERCDLIDSEPKRVMEKDLIWKRMLSYIKGDKTISKLTLIKQGRLGCYVAFAAAVSTNPTSQDPDVIFEINPNKISAPNAQHKLIDAISAIKDRVPLTEEKRNKLLLWAKQMPNLQDGLKNRVDKLLSGI